MQFTKMQGTGNDYIYFYDQEGVDFSALALALSPRHTGIGGDGVIHIKKGGRQGAPFTMEMFNADGSQGAMCGNGIRCVGKYLYDQGHTQSLDLKVDTLAGVRRLLLHPDSSGKIHRVTVSMGRCTVQEKVVLSILGLDLVGTPVSMGNPHFVVEWADIAQLDLPRLGCAIQQHPLFQAEGVNVEFYTPSPTGFTMRVWERGSGETLACGTGACGCFGVGREKHHWQDKVTAQLRGGTLTLWQEDQEIWMEGEAVTLFTGEFPLDNLLERMV